jgi:hypothetical protein
MANLREMSRVLYGHDWASVEDWADTLRLLADLTDEQIDEIAPAPATAPHAVTRACAIAR